MAQKNNALNCNRIMRHAILKSMLTDVDFLVNIFSCVALNGLAISSDNLYLKDICVGYDIAEASIILKQIRSYKRYITDLVEKLKNNESYKECLSRYDEYVGNIATYLKSIGIEESVCACMYITAALKAGFFSKTLSCGYKKYKYDPLFASDILGARVVQGEYVCRHATQFLNDILKKLNIEAEMCSVRISSKAYSELNNYEKATLQDNHAISVVNDERGKFSFDITNYCFANFTDEKHQLNIVDADDENYYLSKFGIQYLSLLWPEYIPAMNEKNMHLSLSQLYIEQFQVDDLFSNNIEALKEFYDDNRENINKIAKLEEQIAPRSNKLIKEWIIK